MKTEHKVTKDIFKPAKAVPTIQAAAKDMYEVRHARKLPFIKHTVMSPSQPHSKMSSR
jgi:hypothetical protein